jgi:murein L,D-transpeptidase YcbB/YkuD
MKRATLLAVTLLCLSLWQQVIAGPDVSSYIRSQIDRMRSGDCVEIDDCPISSTILLPALYEKYGYQLIWKNADAVSQLVAAIEASYEDGLDPQDYHLDGIRRLQASLGAGGDSATRAELDLVLTDSLVRLGYHLQIGKVDPESLDSNWNMERTLELDPILKMSAAIDSAEVTSLVAALRPQAAIYHDLKQALADYRRLQADGGWPAVPPGDSLKPGMNDPRVPAIRRRANRPAARQPRTGTLGAARPAGGFCPDGYRRFQGPLFSRRPAGLGNAGPGRHGLPEDAGLS